MAVLKKATICLSGSKVRRDVEENVSCMVVVGHHKEIEENAACVPWWQEGCVNDAVTPHRLAYLEPNILTTHTLRYELEKYLRRQVEF